jgi:hypothetical protein
MLCPIAPAFSNFLTNNPLFELISLPIEFKLFFRLRTVTGTLLRRLRVNGKAASPICGGNSYAPASG